MLTYVPSNANFDGRFRAIDVKVKRPGVAVFARNGYRALRQPVPLPVLGYEGAGAGRARCRQAGQRFPVLERGDELPGVGPARGCRRWSCG